MDCYIYYKSKIEHATEICRSVELLHTGLAGKLDYLPRLQRRPEPSNGLITWMEIYQDVPQDFEQILCVAVTQSGIQKLINGERRLEYFMSVQN